MITQEYLKIYRQKYREKIQKFHSILSLCIREELFIAYKTAWKFVASSINHLQVVVWILKYNPLSFPSFILLFIVPTHLQVSRTNRILIKPT